MNILTLLIGIVIGYFIRYAHVIFNKVKEVNPEAVKI